MTGEDAFSKGNALGNDYLVLDPCRLSFPLGAAAVRLLCDRQEGVGGDGIVALGERDGEALSVEVFNADGSRAEVSGNGLRIAARVLVEAGRMSSPLTLLSAGRSYPVTIEAGSLAAIDLPPARVDAVASPLEIGGRTIAVTRVDVGNPHAVVEASEVDEVSWPRLASILERHPAFPAGANVERLRRRDRDTLEILIHERGVGPTRASGTGACAAAAAAVALGRVEAGLLGVAMPGGTVTVEVAPGRLRLRGPVSIIFTGRLSAETSVRLRALAGV